VPGEGQAEDDDHRAEGSFAPRAFLARACDGGQRSSRWRAGHPRARRQGEIDARCMPWNLPRGARGARACSSTFQELVDGTVAIRHDCHDLLAAPFRKTGSSGSRTSRKHPSSCANTEPTDRRQTAGQSRSRSPQAIWYGPRDPRRRLRAALRPARTVPAISTSFLALSRNTSI
jgi:hypothetical protein